MTVRLLLFLIIIAAGADGMWATSTQQKNYNVDKTSPDGTYRVMVNVKVKSENDLMGHFTEEGKIQVLKGKEIVYAHQWKYRDNWEPTFIDAKPIVEWVANNALRMGGDNSRQPFTDELVISNDTSEQVKHVGISCGKYESFEVFDIGPGGRVSLHPSPGLNPDVSGRISLGYGGETSTGKSFVGVLEREQPDGPLKLQITLQTKDLQP